MPNVGETQKAMKRPGPGWLECIGLSVRRDQFPELFEKIGSEHGSLNDAHFNLPSTPYTYIYAGGSADTIGETPPSVPGETPDMVPVGVPPSPIVSMTMEPRPGGARQVGPDDPTPGILVRGMPPGSVAEVERTLAKTQPMATKTGTAYADPIEQKAQGESVQVLDERDRLGAEAAKAGARDMSEARAEFAAEGASRVAPGTVEEQQRKDEAAMAAHEANVQRQELTRQQATARVPQPRK